MSGVGDVNGDGIPDIAVGSLLGRLNDDLPNFRLGVSIANAGDFNRDGLNDIIVGAYGNRIKKDGLARIIGFKSFMESSTTTISAAAGGNIDLSLDFPKTAKSDHYRLLISASGTGPIHFGVDIPLTMDTLVQDSFFGNYPVPNSNAQGTLDALGDASASLTILAGINPSLIGRTFHLATIANSVGKPPKYSSVAVPITVTP